MQKEVMLIINSSHIQRSWYGATEENMLHLSQKECYDNNIEDAAREIISSNESHKVCAWQEYEETAGRGFQLITGPSQLEKKFSVKPQNFLPEVILN